MPFPNILLIMTDDQRDYPDGGTARTQKATNPRAFTDTTNWTTASMVTFERTASLPTTGGLPEGITTGFHGVGNATADRAILTSPVINGNTYRYSVYVRIASLSATGIVLRVNSADGVTQKATTTAYSTVGGDFTRLDVSFTADSTEDYQFRVQQLGAGAADWHWTAVLIEQAPDLGWYFDGATVGGAWTGIAHSSTSTIDAIETMDALPNIREEFADRGTRFTRCFATTPVCGPSRCSIYSGLYASQHGAHTNDMPSEWNPWFSLQRQLQAIGYRTGIVGKYLNFISTRLAPYFDYRVPVGDSTSEAGNTLREAEGFINTAGSRPWFLSFSTNTPHVPYSGVPETATHFPDLTLPASAAEASLTDKHASIQDDASTFDEQEAIDNYIGQMNELAALDETIPELFDLFTTDERNAMLCIFMSDNGFLWGEHKLRAKQWPYLESAKIPLYISYVDGGVEEAATDTRLAANIDIAPTILDAIGKESDYPMSGLSLIDADSDAWGGGDDAARNDLYLEFPTEDNTPAWRARLTGPRSDIRHYIDWLDTTSVEVEAYTLTTDPTEELGSNTAVADDQTALDAVDLSQPSDVATLTISDGNREVEIPGIPIPQPAPVVLGGGEATSPSPIGNTQEAGLYQDGFWLAADALIMPVPAFENTYAEGADMEGKRRIRSHPENTTGSGKLYIKGRSLWDHADNLQDIFASANANGGTITWKRPLGEPVIYDLESCRLSEFPQDFHLAQNRFLSLSFEFEAAPYARRQQSAVFTEQSFTGPVGAVAIDNVGGHVPALGDLTLTDSSTQRREYAEVGVDAYPAFYEDVALALDPDFFWRLDSSDREAIGASPFFVEGGLFDRSGNAKHGDLVAGSGGMSIGTGASLLIGDNTSSTDFDGVGNRVESTFSAFFETGAGAAQRFTLASVAVQDTNGADMVLFGGDGGTSAPLLRIDSGTTNITWRIQANSGAATSSTTWSSAVPAAGTPFHYVLTHDPIANTAELWIDGIFQGEKTGLTALLSTPGNFKLSAYAISTGQPFDGRQQAVAGWNSILSDDDIRMLYIAAHSPYLIDGDHLMTADYAGATTTHSGSISTNVVRTNATMIPVAACSTGPLPHQGPHRVYCRAIPQSGGDKRVQLLWRVGKGSWREEGWRDLRSGEGFQDLDLANIEIEHLDQGPHSWEGLLMVHDPDGSGDIDIDTLELVPADNWGRARAPIRSSVVTAFLAQDGFGLIGTGLDLNGTTAPTGGTWTAPTSFDAGGSDVIPTGIIRTAISDSAPGLARLANNEASVSVQLDTSINTVPFTAGDVQHGILARYVDADNYLVAALGHTWESGFTITHSLFVIKVVGGTATALGLAISPYFGGLNSWSLKLSVDTDGNWAAWIIPTGQPFRALPTVHGQDDDLATGGVLATGKVGLYDQNESSTAITRVYGNFAAWGNPTITDAVLFASQSAEFKHDAMLREDSDGTTWGTVPVPEGQHLKLPPTRTGSIRLVTRLRRGDTVSGVASTGTGDSVSADLLITQRVLLSGK